MKRDLVLTGLLAIAVVEAGALLIRRGVVDTPWAAQPEVRLLGDPITIEDLARGCLALEQGRLPTVAPLTDTERDELRTLLSTAAAHRDSLLQIEGELAAEELRLATQARAVAATLTPEQRAWIVQQRNTVSVGSVEGAYWDTLLQELGP